MTICETLLRSMVVADLITGSRYGPMDDLLVVMYTNASLLLDANQQQCTTRSRSLNERC